MDTFWINNNCYINSFFKGFEKQVTTRLGEIDMKIMPYLDIIVFLTQSENGIRNFIKKRERKFDNNEL